MATHSPTPKEQFIENARRAVQARDEEGRIPSHATLIHPYRLLDPTEQFSVRLWMQGEIKGAMARLDTKRASAWRQVLERVTI